MRTFGILAFPASHSKSPQMQMAAFHYLGIEACFERYEIPSERLNDFFEENFRKKKNIDGLAVSIPYKEAVISFLEEIDEPAREIGAVNTIFWKAGKLFGTNTDFLGFSRALAESYTVEGKKVLVLGAGGAARAIVFALICDRADQIIVANRSTQKAEELAHHFGVQWKKTEELRPEEYDLVINATPLGMEGENEGLSPIPVTFWRAHLAAFDLVYTPRSTRFLRDAEKAGARVISGERMFLFQGMEQFHIWTGMKAPQEIMERVLKDLSKDQNP